MAPNHFMSEPWRFRLMGKKGIAELIKLNEGRAALFSGYVVLSWLRGWPFLCLSCLSLTHRRQLLESPR